MDTKDSLIGIGLLGVGGMLLYNNLRKSQERKREETVLQQTATNPTVQQAQLLRQAMNPNKPIPMSWDGTDEQLVMQTAAAITDLASVQQAYRALYDGADLMGDLRSELSSKAFEQFMWQITNNARTKTQVASDGTVTAMPVQAAKNYAHGKGYKVWAIKDVVLRKTPQATTIDLNMLHLLSLPWLINTMVSAKKTNVIELCKASQFIGYTTGRSQIDAGHHIPFIEVTYKLKGDYKGAPKELQKRHGELVQGWVSASADYTFQTASFKEGLDKGCKLPVYKT